MLLFLGLRPFFGKELLKIDYALPIMLAIT